MKHTNNGDKFGSLLKADLILSDYTLLTDAEEKRILLNLLDRYIGEIDDPKISLIFNRMTTTENANEKDLYIEILTDIFSDFKRGGDND